MAMTLRLTEAEDRALTEQAAREHRSKQEVVRAAILEVRDWGLLEAALARPKASVFGEDAYPDVHAKAARCCTRSSRITPSWMATSAWAWSRSSCSTV